MHEQHFSSETDTQFQPAMCEAAAAMLKRTRIAWHAGRETSQVLAGKLPGSEKTVPTPLKGCYQKRLAAKL